MPDPIDELFELMDLLQSRRFWGDVIFACGLFLLLLSMSTGPLAPRAAAIPAVLHLGTLAALGGLLLDNPTVCGNRALD